MDKIGIGKPSPNISHNRFTGQLLFLNYWYTLP